MSKLRERLAANYYTERRNQIYRENPKDARARWSLQGQVDADFRKDLEDEYGITDALANGKVTPEKAGKLFNKAWQDGHSAGYGEVDIHYSELVDLVL
jgi:hypothetical protein